jgi:histidyl-tRNA synthetase
MKNIIPPVKGTREFYPQEMALRTWLYTEIRKVSESYGYQEYDGPFLESIDLYAAKSGEELVKEQSFVFPDRGGNLIALRPELTPSLARMVAQKQNDLLLPLRWWSFGPFWRYERPQKGRTREFFQWNIDLIGVNTPEADAELVSICANLFANLGFTPKEVKVLVNDRRLMDAEISELGFTAEVKPLVLKLIDRRDKMPAEAWESFVIEKGINHELLDGLKNLLKNKNLYKKSTVLTRFFNAVQGLGYQDFIEYDPGIIRGLDYYTGIVFEAKDMGMEGRAILGGGRYDNLVADVGGNPLPGVGFAMGDVVLPLVLESYGKIPELASAPAQILVTVFDENSLKDSLMLSSQLRKAGMAVLCYPEPAKLEKQLKFADRVGVRFVLIVGPDEAARDEVNLKDLESKNQVKIKRGGIVTELIRLLADGSRV